MARWTRPAASPGYQALRNGAYHPWDYQSLQQASQRYMRNHMRSSCRLMLAMVRLTGPISVYMARWRNRSDRMFGNSSCI